MDGARIRGILESALPMTTATASADDCNLRRNLDAMEKQLLLRALDRSGGRKKDAPVCSASIRANLGYYLRKHSVSATN
jgi:transcriptional regulator with GAF, ATPase, and Fis domain